MKYTILRTVSRESGARVKATSLKLRDDDIAIESYELGESEVAELGRDDSILAASPVMPISIPAPPQSAATEPEAGNSENADLSWGLKAIEADSCRFTGDGVKVAVLDTGIRQDFHLHAAFKRKADRIYRKNFTSEMDFDINGHGTHCAGTIFADDVDNLQIGVAPDISQLLVGKVIGKGSTTETLLSGIHWAAMEMDATIISMSLGIDCPALMKKLLDNSYPTDVATSIVLDCYAANVRLFDKLSTYLLFEICFMRHPFDCSLRERQQTQCPRKLRHSGNTSRSGGSGYFRWCIWSRK